jgi:hypothetical protein
MAFFGWIPAEVGEQKEVACQYLGSGPYFGTTRGVHDAQSHYQGS